MNKRWLRGKYRCTQDAADALAFFVERTQPDAGLGVDYEQMAESLLHSGYGSAGDFSALLSTRRDQILAALKAATTDTRALWLWKLRRVDGWKTEKIARTKGSDPESVSAAVARVDRSLSEVLYRRGMIDDR